MAQHNNTKLETSARWRGRGSRARRVLARRGARLVASFVVSLGGHCVGHRVGGERRCEVCSRWSTACGERIVISTFNGNSNPKGSVRKRPIQERKPTSGLSRKERRQAVQSGFYEFEWPLEAEWVQYVEPIVRGPDPGKGKGRGSTNESEPRRSRRGHLKPTGIIASSIRPPDYYEKVLARIWPETTGTGWSEKDYQRNEGTSKKKSGRKECEGE